MHALAWRAPSRSQLALWRSLTNDEARQQEGLFLAEGFKVVSELVRSDYTLRALLVMEEKKMRWEGVLAPFARRGEMYCLTAAQWHPLTQDKNPEGIIAVADKAPPFDLASLPEAGNIVLAYRINNPNNLGALVRTAHWFGFGALLISRDSVDFTNPKVVRTSMGSLFHLPVIAGLDFEEVMALVKKKHRLIAGHSKGGMAPHHSPRPIALLMGSESHGLPDHLTARADEIWCIPGAGGAESLSLPQAAAIMMYESVKH